MGISSSELEEIKSRLLNEGYRVVRLTPQEAQNFRLHRNHRRPWKTTEVKSLSVMFKNKEPIFEISLKLGRTIGACLAMLCKLGLIEYKSGDYFAVETKKFYYEG